MDSVAGWSEPASPIPRPNRPCRRRFPPCSAGLAPAGHPPPVNARVQVRSAVRVADTSRVGSARQPGAADSAEGEGNHPDIAALDALLEYPATNPGRFESADTSNRGGRTDRTGYACCNKRQWDARVGASAVG